jgi:hypothetical protein
MTWISEKYILYVGAQVLAILFVSDIATSWSSYERLMPTGANWEQAGSDFEAFHSDINRERIPMAARIDTASSIFSSMAESVHAFSKSIGKLQLYHLFYSFPNRISTCLPNETGFI